MKLNPNRDVGAGLTRKYVRALPRLAASSPACDLGGSNLHTFRSPSEKSAFCSPLSWVHYRVTPSNERDDSTGTHSPSTISASLYPCTRPPDTTSKSSENSTL